MLSTVQMSNTLVISFFLLLSSASGFSRDLQFMSRLRNRCTGLMMSCQVRFLESNSWELKVNNFLISVDPVLGQLDFGIPALYAGNKKFINEKSEIDNVAENSDLVLISQGFDDHAHSPTLKILARKNPDLPYLCPPSALSILTKCGIRPSMIRTILPGQEVTFDKGKTSIKIKATSGALLGPPWQQKENGYIISPSKSSTKFPSVYYEPHCMYDEKELSRLQADVVISPVVSQELPAFTLVAGGSKALKLAGILKSKFLIPLANGELDQTGLLAKIIKSKGSENEFLNISKKAGSKLKVLTASPGQPIKVPAV